MADYIVQKGDTLSKIAKAHNMNLEDLCKANGIKMENANLIHIGQKLSLGSVSEETTPVADKAPEASAETIKAETERLQQLQNAMDKEEGFFERNGKKLDTGLDMAEKFFTEDIPEGFDEAIGYVDEKVTQGKEWVKDKKDAAIHKYEQGKEALAREYNEGKEAVREAIDDAKEWKDEKVAQAKHKVKETVEDTEKFFTEDIPEGFDEAIGYVDEKVTQGKEWVKDKKDAAIHKYEQGKEALAREYNEGKEWVKDKKDAAIHKYEQGKEALAREYNEGKEWVKDKKDAAIHKYQQGKEALAREYNEGKEAVREAIDDAKEWKDEKVAQAKHKVNETKEQIAQTAENADKAVRAKGREMKEGVKSAFDDAKIDIPRREDRTQALENASTPEERRRIRGKNIREDIQDSASEYWNEAVDSVEDVARDAYNFAKGTYNKFTNWFKE